MNSLIKLCLIFCFTTFLSLNAHFDDSKHKERMIEELQTIKNIYEAGYAPGKWKGDLYGYDLNTAFEEAKNEVIETESISTKDFQKILKKFVAKMKDYHVSIVFESTESSQLPFTVKGAQGRYFINWIDHDHLSQDASVLSVGDEIVQWNGRPIQSEITSLIDEMGQGSNPKTDNALAAMKLTVRLGASGDIVPKGVFPIQVVSAHTGEIKTVKLSWVHTKEGVMNPLDFLETLPLPFSKKKKKKVSPPMVVSSMGADWLQKYIEVDMESIIGSRKSFLPPLGPVIWSNAAKNGEEEFPFDAYVYLLPSEKHGKMYKSIGYIRIPHYIFGTKDAELFGCLLDILEDSTDALVIDQLHNGGGSAAFLNDVLSMVSVSNTTIPKHHLKITQADAKQALDLLEELQYMEETPGFIDWFNEQSQDSEVHQLFSYKGFSESILDEWNKGITLTRPLSIFGSDVLQPHPKHHYTKPILVLIDEMDFSCADFFPAILQDNQRASLFGSRTAGAGGAVKNIHIPNRYGIESFSYTATLADRDGTRDKIEDRGVNPDIEYEITPEDIQYGYRGYINAVNKAVESLIPGLSIKLCK